MALTSVPRSRQRVLAGIRRRWDDWRSRDHWWVGRLVELSGDAVTIEGCRFSLSSPVIATALKSRIVLWGVREWRTCGPHA